MSFILRVLNNKNLWERDRQPDWVAEGEIQADVVKDMRTEAGELSVWRVSSDRSDLNRVIAAFTASRERVDKFDYILVQESAILELTDILYEHTESTETPDDYINQNHHFDIRHLNPSKLALVIDAFVGYGELGRLTPSRVKRLLRNSRETDYIDWERVVSRIHQDIS